MVDNLLSLVGPWSDSRPSQTKDFKLIFEAPLSNARYINWLTRCQNNVTGQDIIRLSAVWYISETALSSGYHTLYYKQALSLYDLKCVERDIKANTKKNLPYDWLFPFLACFLSDKEEKRLSKTCESSKWKTALPLKKLGGHKVFTFNKNDVQDCGLVSHVRLSIFPDGGLSRLKIWGQFHSEYKSKL